MSISPIQEQIQFIKNFCDDRGPINDQTYIEATFVFEKLQNADIQSALELSDLEKLNGRITEMNQAMGGEVFPLVSTASKVAAAALPSVAPVTPITAVELAAIYRQFAMLIQATIVGDSCGFGNQFIEECRDTEYLAGCLDEVVEALKSGQFRGMPLRMSDDSVFTILTVLAMITCQRKGLVGVNPLVNEIYKLYTRYKDPKIDPMSETRFNGATMTMSLDHCVPAAIRKTAAVGEDADLAKAIEQIEKIPNKLIFDEIPFSRNTQGCGAAMRAAVLALLENLKIVRNEGEFLAALLLIGKATHPDPIGFLGGVISPLLAREAMRNEPISTWVPKICAAIDLDVGPLAGIAKDHLAFESWHNEQFCRDWRAVERKWREYARDMNTYGDTPKEHERVRFLCALPSSWKPANDAQFEEQMVQPLSHAEKNAWPGEKGHDAPLLAFHTVHTVCKRLAQHLGRDFNEATTPEMVRGWLRENPETVELADRWLFEIGCLHGGDSDSTGAIALQLWAAIAQEFALIKEFTRHLDRIPAQDLFPEAIGACHFLPRAEQREGGGGAVPVVREAAAAGQLPQLTPYYDFSGPDGLRFRTSFINTLKRNFLPDEIDPIFDVQFVLNQMIITCSKKYLASTIQRSFKLDYSSTEEIYTFQIDTKSEKFWSVMQQSGFQLDKAVKGDVREVVVKKHLSYYGITETFERGS